MSNLTPKVSRRVRFEEVSPAHEYAAFFNVSIAPLVAHLGLPIFDGYDDLDDLQLAFLTLPSGETVTLGEYAGAPGTSLYIDIAMQNISQIIFDSCLQLRVSRQELEWIHPDWQVDVERLATEHGEIESIARPRLESLPPNQEHEPIDCFYCALEIYTRPNFPEHWAMLQHNLGLAYFDRIKGERWENLQKSIECYNKSLEVFTQDKFPKKWQLNQEDLSQSQAALQVEKQNLIRDILDRPIKGRYLSCADLSHANLRCATLRGAKLINADLNGANLSGATLRCADLRGAKLINADLNGADLRGARLRGTKLNGADLIRADLSRATLGRADLNGADLNGANLIDADLRGANLSGATLINAYLRGTKLSHTTNVDKARFGHDQGISESMREDLRTRGAIFEDFPGDRSESRTLVPR